MGLNCLIWVFLGSGFKHLLPHLKSTLWNLCNCLVSQRTKKTFKLVPETPFSKWIWKNYCHIWNQHPQTCWNAKVLCKKTLILGHRVLYFGRTFRPELKKKLLPYLRSIPSNLLKWKVWCLKKVKFGIKLDWYLKKHIWNQHLQIYEKLIFNQCSIFFE